MQCCQNSGEPCKHQQATQYHLQAPNLIPYFNSDGRYLHAIIALGDEAGDRGFYKSIRENKVENSRIYRSW